VKNKFLFILCMAVFQTSAAPVRVDEAVSKATENASQVDIEKMSRDAQADRQKFFEAFEKPSDAGIKRQTDLYQKGMGALLAPATEEVISCRNKTDPTCSAIQVLDRGFPERPHIPDSVLAGRDGVVNNAGSVPGRDVPGGCKEYSVGVKGSESVETCSVGSWFSDVLCHENWVPLGTVEAKHYSCKQSTVQNRNFYCDPEGEEVTKTTWIERCIFGQEALVSSGRVVQSTKAFVRAEFPAVCKATQGHFETVKCSEFIDPNANAGCKPGERFTFHAKNSLQPVGACSDRAQLEVTYVCGNTGELQIRIKDYPKRTLRVGEGLKNLPYLRNRKCRANYKFKELICKGESCNATVLAETRNGTGRCAAYELTAIFVNEDFYRQKAWVDTCKNLRKDSGQ
jgi:hypothetical protein